MGGKAEPEAFGERTKGAWSAMHALNWQTREIRREDMGMGRWMWPWSSTRHARKEDTGTGMGMGMDAWTRA